MDSVDPSKLEDLFKMWQSVMSGGWVGAIVGVLMLLLLIVVWWFNRKKANEKAHRETEQGRTENQAELPSKVETVEDSTDAGADHVDAVRAQYSDPSKPKPKRPS